MRHIRTFTPVFLVAIFWIAQVQGTVHAIGHLNATPGVSDHATVPHNAVCVECAALSQAGAAPVLALPATLVGLPTGTADGAISVVVIAADSAAAYRSRAPPLPPM
jgi:hypothetical protein